MRKSVLCILQEAGKSCWQMFFLILQHARRFSMMKLAICLPV
uniref:Uncharacterized protein n=1 Tax=Arundo donax TaxID=35708 RepID=A0A0A9GG75_ARUDO